jgi:nitroreductase
MFRVFSDAQIAKIIEAAGAAPSLHNTQPWRFSITGATLELSAMPDRALPVSDPGARALYISCGAALLNARMAVRTMSADPVVRRLPHPEYPFDVLAVVEAAPGPRPTRSERRLYEAIGQRHTNRGPYSDRAIPVAVWASLEQAAETEHGSLHVLNREQSTTVLRLAAGAGRELAADAAHQAELRRWTATGRDDGIPADALPARPAEAPAPVRADDLLAAAPSQPRTGSVAYEKFPQLAVLTMADDEPEDWLVAGEALQRVLLTATAAGLSASFLYQPIELRDMREDDSLSWPVAGNPQMVLRLGYGLLPAAHAPRRKLGDVRSAPACA